MTITVYTISGAPRPWRVLLGLTFKGLAFDTVVLKASENQHKSADFLALNPRGTVPVVVADDATLRDSIAALAWLDRAYPDPPMFGHSPAEASLVWQQTMDLADYLRAAVDALLTPVFFQGVRTATPELLQSAHAAKVELAGLERALEPDAYLAGSSPSAADAVAFPDVRLVQRATETASAVMNAVGLGDLYRQFPHIGAWVSRIEALPGYEHTQPPHWREAA